MVEFKNHLQSADHALQKNTFTQLHEFGCYHCASIFNSVLQMEQHMNSPKHMNLCNLHDTILNGDFICDSQMSRGQSTMAGPNEDRSRYRSRSRSRSRSNNTSTTQSRQILSIITIPFQRLLTKPTNTEPEIPVIGILKEQQSTFHKLESSCFSLIIHYLTDPRIVSNDRRRLCNVLSQNIALGLLQHSQCTYLNNELKRVNHKDPMLASLSATAAIILSKQQFIVYRQIQEARNVGNLQCTFCRQPLKVNGYVKAVPFICDYCSHGNHLCHLHEMTVVGIHQCLAICPRCLFKNEWKATDKNWHRIEHRKLMIDDEYYTITSTNYDQHSMSLIWINDTLITTRFGVFQNGGSKMFLRLEQSVHKNEMTVSYPAENEFVIPINRYLDMFFAEFGPNITLSNGQQYSSVNIGVSTMKLIVSNIGHIKYSGFVHLSNAIHEVFPDLKQCIEKYQIYWKRLRSEIHKDQTGLSTMFCQAVYANKTSKILSIGSSYKAYKTCYELLVQTPKMERKELIDSMKHNFAFYFGLDKVNKLRKGNEIVNERQRGNEIDKVYVAHPRKNNNNRHKVVQVPEVEQYLKQKYPELLDAITEFKFVITLIMYMIGKHVPVLSFMYELIKETDPTGQFFGNTDLLSYTKQHIVASHIDTVGLIDAKLPLHKLVYAVLKPDIHNEDVSILCNESNILNCHSVGQIGNNGHFELKPGCVYFMMARGLYGGVAHSIHGVDQGMGRVQHGHTQDVNTIVLRPLT